MAAAAILKIEKSPYFDSGLTDFDEILHDDAVWPSRPPKPLKFLKSNMSTLLTVSTVKNLKFQKSKMAAAAILKNLKNSHISTAVWPILTKFGTMMQFDPLDRPDR